MIFIIGLGNPGKSYEHTRHNIGFAIVEQIALDFSITFNNQSKFGCELASLKISGNQVFLVKPTTYMNLSGTTVSALYNYYKCQDTSDVIVIHDDIDLELGHIRFKKGGGSGGHNGIKSIDQHIGTDYWRIRCGVGRPQHQNVSDYVLSKFTSDENVVVNKMINNISDNVDLIIKSDWDMLKTKIK